MLRSRSFLWLGVVLPASVVGLVVACGSGGAQQGASSFPIDGGGPDDASGDATLGDDSSQKFGGGGDSSSSTFSDFPASPVIVEGDGGVGEGGTGEVPDDAGGLFGAPTQTDDAGAGPCLYEPEANALYPQNWLRPRFSWTPMTGQNLFELRLHAANQVNDLVVYTTASTWTMPVAMWDALRQDSAGQAMTMTIRGGVWNGSTFTGEAIGTSGALGIAPVQATGAIVYWTTTGGSALKGFQPGDESVVPVLTPTQVQSSTTTTCIGCHTSAPGGEYVGFTVSSPGWQNALALIDEDAGVVGSQPPFLASGGAAALAQPNLGISSFSAAHWTTGDRREVAAYDNNGAGPAVLRWFDLEATTADAGAGVIARTGDPQSAGAPSWSHDGNTIAYVSTNHFCDGRLGRCDNQYNSTSQDPGAVADLYTVPYASGAGGTATPVTGASDPSFMEYYPAFSPDDQYLAFTRIGAQMNMYNDVTAEVLAIPADGGTATRLAANDPPACTGKASPTPGVTNSWPKWAPTASAAGGKTYYWLVFSSTRAPSGNPQLYMTAVVVGADGTIEPHGAVYLWNQPVTENNHTPAWDTFKVQSQPPPKVK